MLAPTAQQCTAKAKSTGARCNNPAVSGSNVCRLHGGKTPRGIASPNYSHGRYSRYTRANISEKLDRLLADPDILQLHDEIRLVTLRIDEKLDRLETIDSREVHETIKAQVKRARMAYKSEAYGALEDALDTLEDIADQRILHYMTDEDIRKDLDARRKLIETQRKLNADAEQMLTAVQVMTIMKTLLHAIKENVDDRTALQNIQQAFMLALGDVKAERVDNATL